MRVRNLVLYFIEGYYMVSLCRQTIANVAKLFVHHACGETFPLVLRAIRT